jgi:hypothetical protein
VDSASFPLQVDVRHAWPSTDALAMTRNLPPELGANHRFHDKIRRSQSVCCERIGELLGHETMDATRLSVRAHDGACRAHHDTAEVSECSGSRARGGHYLLTTPGE